MKKIKKIITIIVMSILAVVSVFSFTACKSNETETAEIESSSNLNANSTRNTGKKVKGISAYFVPLSAPLTTGQGENCIVREVNAIVYPETAENKRVEFSLAWANGSALSGEDVSEYVKVEQDYTGSTHAMVKCYKDFGDDTIILTARTIEGNFTANCNCTYAGLCTNIEVSIPSMQMYYTEERGNFYYFTPGTSEFNGTGSGDYVLEDILSINATNVLGEVGKTNYTFSLVGHGSFLTRVSTNGLTFDLKEFNLDTLGTADGPRRSGVALMKFLEIKKITSSGKHKITVTKTLSEFMVDNELHYYNDSNPMGKRQGAIAEFIECNADYLPTCYYEIIVTETYSGTTGSVKFWVDREITGIAVDGSGNIEF